MCMVIYMMKVCDRHIAAFAWHSAEWQRKHSYAITLHICGCIWTVQCMCMDVVCLKVACLKGWRCSPQLAGPRSAAGLESCAVRYDRGVSRLQRGAVIQSHHEETGRHHAWVLYGPEGCAVVSLNKFY